MGHHNGAFVGIDTSKLRNAIAVAKEGRGGDLRFFGEIDTAEAATRKLVTKLATKYRQLTFCYEARPTHQIGGNAVEESRLPPTSPPWVRAISGKSRPMSLHRLQ